MVALLTGGGDKHYAVGLATSLIAQGVTLDYIGSDQNTSPELEQSPLVNVLNLRGDQRMEASMRRKVTRVIRYYARLFAYAARAKPRVFHILWNNKLEYLDRTLVLLYYRILGKRLVHTAHNVNPRTRDGNDTWANRFTLRLQYRLVHQVFVHTPRMKQEMMEEFAVPDEKITVIPYGINNALPVTALTPAEARARLGLKPDEKVMLFYGYIAPYKGLGYLIDAMRLLAPQGPACRLVIAGQPKRTEDYWVAMREKIVAAGLLPQVSEHIEFISDADTEIFFKAADVLILSYTQIFQSGVLFVGYSFGLPVIVSDVGALREEVVEGENGYVCRPCDAPDLAATISRYFASDLYRDLPNRRRWIQEHAEKSHSWATVAGITKGVYTRLLSR